MPLLTTADRLTQAAKAGHIVLKHITLASAAQAAESGSNPLDPKATALTDGFYQIVQWKDDADKPSLASVTSPAGVTSTSSVPVVMGTDTDFLSNFWKLTRQYGLKNGFTVVPVATNIPDTDPETGATTYDKDVRVIKIDKLAILYVPSTPHPTESLTNSYRSGDETSSRQAVSIGTLRPQLQPELFELIRCDIVENSVSISSVDNVIATASNSTIVKKFYFGTGPVSNSDATSYVSVQLSTSARDQGWADQPQAGLYSWFEIAILTKDMTLDQVVTDQIKTVDGKPLTWISHDVPLTSTYTDQDGPVFAKDHALFKNLKAGNVIAVLACAQYAYWKCDARSGKLNFRQLVAKATNTK
ncbi:hypothetical protein GALMADRAFT_65251 [Galerina marginata CBS 339.88]|uniref:Uncharacterized protein n=1 Tax=Galerina marginata (strain CBS 339.88) TaxID=685588 RepID=A0A067T6B2_GALM3|nr:hypothetical protein GALMADRAFT_65251 [Galerina marginata CBS 339.88]